MARMGQQAGRAGGTVSTGPNRNPPRPCRRPRLHERKCLKVIDTVRRVCERMRTGFCSHIDSSDAPRPTHRTACEPHITAPRHPSARCQQSTATVLYHCNTWWLSPEISAPSRPAQLCRRRSGEGEERRRENRKRSTPFRFCDPVLAIPTDLLEICQELIEATGK